MIACYVISLKRSYDRRTAISASMDGLGIPFEFIDAVDARDGLDDDPRIDRAGTLRTFGRPMSEGEYACALSHSLACERLLATDASHALILEDDAIPMPKLKRFIEGGHFRRAPMFTLYHHSARVFPWTRRALFEGVSAWRLAMSSTIAVGYTIDRTSAERLLAASRPVRATADWPMDLADLGAWVVTPRLVDHPPFRDPSQSTLTVERGRGDRFGLHHDRTTGFYWRRKLRKLVSRKITTPRQIHQG